MKQVCGRVVAALVLAASAGASAEPAPEPKWMAHCARNLGAGHLAELAVNTYCGCMAGIGDDAEMLAYSQKKLESSFPWAHKR